MSRVRGSLKAIVLGKRDQVSRAFGA